MSSERDQNTQFIFPEDQHQPYTEHTTESFSPVEPDHEVHRKPSNKFLIASGVAAFVATGVAVGLYLKGEEPVQPQTSPEPTPSASPTPETTPTPSASPTPEVTEAPIALPETPESLVAVESATVEEFITFDFDEKAAYYTWLIAKYELEPPETVSTDPAAVPGTEDPLAELAYAINEGVPHILEHSDSPTRVDDARKLFAAITLLRSTEETTYPDEHMTFYSVRDAQIADEQAPDTFEYTIQDVIEHPGPPVLYEVVVSDTFALGMRPALVLDYEGQESIVWTPFGMGLPTEGATETPSETESVIDIAKYEAMEVAEFEVLSEAEKAAYGVHLLDEYDLDLPAELPESLDEVSATDIIANRNFLINEALPSVLKEGGADQAKKFVRSFMSPQPGDTLDSGDINITRTIWGYDQYIDQAATSGEELYLPTSALVELVPDTSPSIDRQYDGLAFWVKAPDLNISVVELWRVVQGLPVNVGVDKYQTYIEQ